MKNRFILAAALFASAISFQACDDNSNDPQPSSSDPITFVQQGTWRISLHSDDGADKTSRFSNYNFTFSNTTVTARKDTIAITGAYRKGTDDSKEKFYLEFNPSLSPWNELNEDWEIVESTHSKLRLKDDSGSGTDLLTFEKN
jgi:hypothetical protein